LRILPDRNETFIHHNLSPNLADKLNEVIAKFPDVIINKGTVPMGQALVEPFDIVLKPGALDIIGSIV